MSFYLSAPHRDLHSFPTRRSSDLRAVIGDHVEDSDIRLVLRQPAALERLLGNAPAAADEVELVGLGGPERRWMMGDRKSTRLNSSHTVISYAVFCLKKKNQGRVVA